MSQFSESLHYQKTDGTSGTCRLYTTTNEVPNNWFQTEVGGQTVYAALVSTSHALASPVRVYRNEDGGTYAIAKYTPYVVGQTILESSTGGTSGTLYIESEGYYRVIAVGGGSGCALVSRGSYAQCWYALGCSGSAFDATFYLGAGVYAYNIGDGGFGSTQSGVSTVAAGNGGNTNFGTSYAYGGTAGTAGWNGNGSVTGSGGASPTLTYTATTIYLNSTGNTGKIDKGGSNSDYSKAGADSVYSGYGYGGGFDYTPTVSTRRANSGGSGYLKVVFVSY